MCRIQTEGQLVEAAEHLPGFARNCVLGAKEMGIFTTSVLITLREITNHARQKRASHHLMTLALTPMPLGSLTNATVGHILVRGLVWE